jgi:hypothetical protein
MRLGGTSKNVMINGTNIGRRIKGILQNFISNQ